MKQNLISNKKISTVTTSWDDGHKLDIKLARLLKKYGIKGTFYVSPRDHEFEKGDLLTEVDIKAISKDFEIGAHTLSHPHLSKIPLANAKDEIIGSKKYLEDVIDKTVVSFCYPYGDYNESTEELVKDAGFHLARTTKRFTYSKSDNPFALPTTFFAYNHFIEDFPEIVKFAGINVAKLYRYTNWEYLAMDLFDYCQEQNSLFHLWGHSWEIDAFHAWEKLERVLKYITNKNNNSYITNGEIFV